MIIDEQSLIKLQHKNENNNLKPMRSLFCITSLEIANICCNIFLYDL